MTVFTECKSDTSFGFNCLNYSPTQSPCFFFPTEIKCRGVVSSEKPTDQDGGVGGLGLDVSSQLGHLPDTGVAGEGWTLTPKGI